MTSASPALMVHWPGGQTNQRVLQSALVLLGAASLWTNLHHRLQFDDAFMFYRYAIHLRMGWGVSWNPDRIPTYGMTSPLWGAIIWAGSFLPLNAEHLLVLLSTLFGMAAAVSMAAAVFANASSPLFSTFTATLAMIAVPMWLSGDFAANARNGMETMLAMGLTGAFCGLLFAWSKRPSTLSGGLLGLVALLAFWARPEAALPMLLAIILAGLLLTKPVRKPLMVLLPIAVLGAGVLGSLFVCKQYFHSMVPLAFYVKSRHFYLGYVGEKQPIHRLILFFVACSPFLGLLIWFTRSRHRPILIVYLIPLLAVLAYLCSLVQIMGGNARYYIPYAPFLIFPAIMVLDQSFPQGRPAIPDKPLHRIVALLFAACLLDGYFPEKIFKQLDVWAEGPKMRYQEAARFEGSRTPLPNMPWVRSWRGLTDEVLVKLPPGAKVAATEVGYAGASIPSLTLIDLSGLNDSQIALHGFDMKSFLDRRPDLVWLPFEDYTFFRGEFYDSKEFLANYVVFDGAFNYGVALRKQSPYYPAMLAAMTQAWKQEYSDYAIEDYEVKSATWNRTPHLLEH